MTAKDALLPIETPRLWLHRLVPAHVPAVVAYRQLPEVMHYLSRRPINAESVLEEIEYSQNTPFGTPGHRVRLVIVLKDTGMLIGDCILKIPENEPRQAELGYAIDPAYQGKGYATEAIQAVVRYAFETLHLHRLTATIFAEHTASIKVVERAGMQREAHFRQAVWRDNRWIDDMVYAVLREEWVEK